MAMYELYSIIYPYFNNNLDENKKKVVKILVKLQLNFYCN